MLSKSKHGHIQLRRRRHQQQRLRRQQQQRGQQKGPIQHRQQRRRRRRWTTTTTSTTTTTDDANGAVVRSSERKGFISIDFKLLITFRSLVFHLKQRRCKSQWKLARFLMSGRELNPDSWDWMPHEGTVGYKHMPLACSVLAGAVDDAFHIWHEFGTQKLNMTNYQKPNDQAQVCYKATHVKLLAVDIDIFSYMTRIVQPEKSPIHSSDLCRHSNPWWLTEKR